MRDASTRARALSTNAAVRPHRPSVRRRWPTSASSEIPWTFHRLYKTKKEFRETLKGALQEKRHVESTAHGAHCRRASRRAGWIVRADFRARGGRADRRNRGGLVVQGSSRRDH